MTRKKEQSEILRSKQKKNNRSGINCVINSVTGAMVNQIEKLKNNPAQYFYDEEQRQKNKVPVINVWR